MRGEGWGEDGGARGVGGGGGAAGGPRTRPCGKKLISEASRKNTMLCFR